MPSFDIVSKTDQHEVTNAVDQANRELSTRFDFRGTDARVELASDKITLIAPTEFQLKQIDEILANKLAKRQVDTKALDYKNPHVALNEARQEIDVRQGVNAELAKKIVKLIKESGFKVQSAIQGDHVRVTGKKRDDLQAVIAKLRETKWDMPLQYENFRD